MNNNAVFLLDLASTLNTHNNPQAQKTIFESSETEGNHVEEIIEVSFDRIFIFLDQSSQCDWAFIIIDQSSQCDLIFQYPSDNLQNRRWRSE